LWYPTFGLVIKVELKAKEMDLGQCDVLVGGYIVEHIENLGNILGTQWELEGNMLGTKET
jgi:hypothetical protein